MRLLVSALESSANLHLNEILKREEFEVVGVFDKEFGNPIVDYKEFNVMGFFDVLPKILFAKRVIKELAQLSKNCDKVLLIDAPSFNIPLAKEIKKVNPKIEIIYYILPKVWAWKKGRIKAVKKYVDKTAYIFPFEKEYWNKTYVGNPLLDEIKEFRSAEEKGGVAFLPGSRKSEIKFLMPLFRELAKKIDKKRYLVIPKIYENDLSIYGDISSFEVVFDTHKALLNSDFAYICSGTATLEAAIIGTPFTLIYKAREIEYLIAKMFVKLNYVGLANIIFEKEGLGEFHREYLQKFDIISLIEEYENSNLSDFQKKSQKLREVLKFGSSENLIKLIKES